LPSSLFGLSRKEALLKALPREELGRTALYWLFWLHLGFMGHILFIAATIAYVLYHYHHNEALYKEAFRKKHGGQEPSFAQVAYGTLFAPTLSSALSFLPLVGHLGWLPYVAANLLVHLFVSELAFRVEFALTPAALARHDSVPSAKTARSAPKSRRSTARRSDRPERAGQSIRYKASLRPPHLSRAEALRILDSRGNQTLEVELAADGKVGIGKVPSGASTGEREALELRDDEFAKQVEDNKATFALKDKSGFLSLMDEAEAIHILTDGRAHTRQEAIVWLKTYSPKGTRVAELRANVLLRELRKAVILQEVDLRLEGAVDSWLKRMETAFGGHWEQKDYFGANAVLAISLAAFRLAAALEGVEPYAYHKGPNKVGPVIYQANILNGGEHADNKVDIQETMMTIVYKPGTLVATEEEAIRVGALLFQKLKAKLKKKGLNTNVGDEGGFAPNVLQNSEYLKVARETIHLAIPGRN
jgi:hypothetical protein